ncbi:MAG: hypothetical protein JO257_23910 [Deltaproteobacteria bacterium]|nr:hypothetical protein [Deltaproteobacteria bacterium]
MLAGHPMMRLYSSDGDRIWLTQVTFRRSLTVAGAPFVHPTWVTYGKGHLYALAAHRRRHLGTLQSMRTQADVCTWMTDTANRIAAWRDTQTPDALLEWDLRQMLGGRYDRDAPVIARHLQIELPTAKLLP